MEPNQRLKIKARHLAYAAAGPPGAAHDASHIDRVTTLALFIASKEGADSEIVELAALLHDAFDHKVSGSFAAARDATRSWLIEGGATSIFADLITEVVDGVSFRGAGTNDKSLSLEGKCVRDADRLDAMGAIGVARAFAFGAENGNPIFDAKLLPLDALDENSYPEAGKTTLNHFFEKLLLLNDRLETVTGRAIGTYRHAFLQCFVRQMLQEIGPPDSLGHYEVSSSERSSESAP